MDKVFILRVSSELFEPIKKNSRYSRQTGDSSSFCDVSKVSGMHLRFDGYIMEDGKPAGARLWCDHGSGYGIDNGTGIIELRPGETGHFSFEGTSMDDEGDPEDFSVDYYLELLDWDDSLTEG